MCNLQQFLKDLRVAILNYRLDLCCFVFSVRIGILLCGCFNVISSMVCLIAVATEAVTPLLANVQQVYMDGEYIKSTCAFAYSSDLCLAVLLLCALYRKDIVLLRYYTYCGLAMLASTVLVYSMVIGAITVLHTALMIISLTYQVYVILLVRSLMVELRQEAKRLELYPNYSIFWTLNDIEAADQGEAYEMHELVNKRRTSVAKPVADTVKPFSEQVKDVEPNKPVKETTKAETNKAQDKDIVQPTTLTVKESVEKKASDPDKDTVQPSTSIVKLKDTIEPKTSKPIDAIQPTTSTKETDKIDPKPETSEKPKAMRYPYKFIAIKIPKEETIKEEKENEDREKGTDKDTLPKEETKEKTKEVAKETKKRKRSIFGRKKNKSEDGTTKDEEKKN